MPEVSPAPHWFRLTANVGIHGHRVMNALALRDVDPMNDGSSSFAGRLGQYVDAFADRVEHREGTTTLALPDGAARRHAMAAAARRAVARAASDGRNVV